MLYGTPNAIPGDSTTVTGTSGDFFGSSTYMMWFGAIQNDKEHINVYTSSNRYFGSKVGKGLQLGFSYLTNACEDRGTSAGTTGSCQRSEEHTSELQSLMRISYAVFCL